MKNPRISPVRLIKNLTRYSFSGTFIPDSTTLQRYCTHDPDIRIYRTDQGDEAAGFLDQEAVDDGDNVVIRSNGAGTPSVTAFEGGTAIQIDTCHS